MIEFDIDWVLVIQFVLATVLPLLVATVTTKVTSGKVKALLLALFAFISTVLTSIVEALISGATLDLGALLLTAGGTFAWAVVAYFGIWRAQGPEGQPSVAENITANVGRTVTLDPGPDGTYRRTGRES